MEEIGRMKQMQLKPFAFILKKKKKNISLFFKMKHFYRL